MHESTRSDDQISASRFPKQRQTRRKHWEITLESCRTFIRDFVCWMLCFCQRISLCGHFLAPFYRVQRACLRSNYFGLILKSCGLNHRNAVPSWCNTPLSARCGAISFFFGCSQHSKWPIPADSDSKGARVQMALIGFRISLLHFYIAPIIFFANLTRV